MDWIEKEQYNNNNSTKMVKTNKKGRNNKNEYHGFCHYTQWNGQCVLLLAYTKLRLGLFSLTGQ